MRGRQQEGNEHRRCLEMDGNASWPWQSGSRGFVDSEVFFWKMATVRLEDDYAPGRRADVRERTADKIALFSP